VQRRSVEVVRQPSANEPGGNPVRKSECDGEPSVMSQEASEESNEEKISFEFNIWCLLLQGSRGTGNAVGMHVGEDAW
jgi:hypothetical protein